MPPLDPPRTNWAGNSTYSARKFLSPATVEEAQAAVRASTHLRVLGSRHSFNALADTPDTQLSLATLQSIELNPAARTVTVGAGVRYGDLAPSLDAQGFALHNLASLPHISVAGAIATATHGSGTGNLATAVSALEFIDAAGNLVCLSRAHNPDAFPGAAVHLGALGVLTRITLTLEPTYQVAQTVYLDLPFSALEDHLEDIFAAGDSVSLFTDWQHSRATQIWIKRRTDRPCAALGHDFHGAHPATGKMHPILGLPAEACTSQNGIPGPWHERLPHFRLEFTPSSGQELQTEYFVPFDQGYAAIRAVETLRDRIAPLLYVTELRAIAADNLWLSPAYQRRSLALHFTWKPDWAAVRALLPQIEAALAPFHPRPHWGKLFTLPAAVLRAEYARLDDFHALAARYDPDGKFRNPFLAATLYA
ncbi:MAG TPA: FAD-binding protein [Acidobacteriaceae bacterium]|jgi:xylitol oxidase|nr:FAD-binding protein [Acidobacteriaceae bacterium]